MTRNPLMTTHDCRPVRADENHRGNVTRNAKTKAWRALAKQTGDLLFQMGCAATMECAFASDHPMLKDVQKALDEVNRLDP